MQHLLLVILGIFLLIFFALALYYGTSLIHSCLRGKKLYLSDIFKDFDQKIFMTIGLGITFFGLYFSSIWLFTTYLNQETLASFFHFLYLHPVEGVYAGLFLFAFCTLLVYFVRMLIKYIYHLL